MIRIYILFWNECVIQCYARCASAKPAMPITNIAPNVCHYTIELGVSAQDLTHIALDNNCTAYMRICVQQFGCVIKN